MGEMWTGSQHGVSVSADLLLPIYWIDADQSTATSRPCRVPDDRKKKRLFSSSSTRVLSSSPPIFDAFGRDLLHVLRLKLDDLRHRRLYFGSDSFSLFLPLSSICEITGKD